MDTEEAWEQWRTETVDNFNHYCRQGLGDALDVAFRYGQIDGDHHKLWVIDQMLRLILGEGYEEFVQKFQASGDYEWQTGIAP